MLICIHIGHQICYKTRQPKGKNLQSNKELEKPCVNRCARNEDSYRIIIKLNNYHQQFYLHAMYWKVWILLVRAQVSIRKINFTEVEMS